MINALLLHYQLEQAGLPVIGVSSDGRVDYSRELTEQENILANQIIASHDPNGLLPQEQDEITATAAKTSFRNLPNWATYTHAQASDAVNNAILTGQTKAQVGAWIDSTVNSPAATKTAFKLLADAIIDIRTILQILAQVIIFLRDIAVRRS